MQARLDAYELICVKMLTKVFSILNVTVVIICTDRATAWCAKSSLCSCFMKCPLKQFCIKIKGYTRDINGGYLSMILICSILFSKARKHTL